MPRNGRPGNAGLLAPETLMKLVDAHCHLESEEFKDRLEPIIQDARQVGVVKLITASISPEQWHTSKAIAERFPEVEFAWGVHPWYLSPDHLEALSRLYQAKEAGAVAIGEIGLDKKIDAPPIDLQRTFFETQLRIAAEIDLPVVLHCRAAFDDLLVFIKKIGIPRKGGILHNFSGSAELARQLAPYGLMFSLGGTLTYRNSRKKQDLLRAIYPAHLVLETDSPDIPPVEARGKPNVPSNIVYSLRAAADILGEPEERIAENTTRNAAQIFGLDL
jgi:TatD DNase family protein